MAPKENLLQVLQIKYLCLSFKSNLINHRSNEVKDTSASLDSIFNCLSFESNLSDDRSNEVKLH
jgi:hypothetical protein